MESLKFNREKFAFDKVKESTSESYSSSVQSFGMLVYRNGLISALAYAQAKNIELYKHISAWIKKHPFIKNILRNDSDEDFLTLLLKLDSQSILIISDEVLLLTDALKEFTGSKI